jgi:hypothetical protein
MRQGKNEGAEPFGIHRNKVHRPIGNSARRGGLLALKTA